MAADLIDTRPNVMAETFTLARKQCTFLPTVKELLDLYELALKRQIDADRAAEQRAATLEAQRVEADRKLHPDHYFSIADLLVDKLPGFGTLPAAKRDPAQRLTGGTCPHCGKLMLGGYPDLRALSPQALRAMADRRDAEQKAKRNPPLGEAIFGTKAGR